MPDAQLFALALRNLDGVGRVTASRLLERFPTYADLCRYPREQILHRIKGAPNAAALVDTLLDGAAMAEALSRAAEERTALQGRQVNLRTPADPDWPAGLPRLPRNERPLLLFLHGNARVLGLPAVALFGRPGLPEAAFERAQETVQQLVARGVVVLGGIQNGFDAVLHKIAALAPAPSIMVASCGLAKVAPPMRPVASQSLRAGGLLMSPFEMQHGPFEHDDRERARTMTTLARALVFFHPELDAAERAALETARALALPLFAASATLADAEGIEHLSEPSSLPAFS